jgi:hypothetical protein
LAFACNENTGPIFQLIGSFSPPDGIDEFVGMRATLKLRSATSTLPDWWKFGSTECRGAAALATSFAFGTGPFSCRDFYEGQAHGGYAYDIGFEGPDQARFRIECAVPFDRRGPVVPGEQYYAFRALIARSKSTGTGSCSGCDTPMCITLVEMQLFQTPEAANDPLLTNPIDRNYVSWQETPPACPATVAVLASVISADADPERVRLAWSTELADEVTVYRRRGAEAWSALARVAVDGSHRVRYEDRDIVPGATYAYRLGISMNGGEIFAGETEVTVPAASQFALGSVSWERSGRSLTLGVTLPRAAPVTIEVFDVSGRRWLSQVIEGLGAGTHEVRVGVPTALPSGVFFARASQDRASEPRRFVIVQ